MKRASAIISVVIIVAILLGALGVGLCVREFRCRRAQTESESATDLDTQHMYTAGQASPEENAQPKDQRQTMRQRWENMSDEEKQQYMARIRERFDTGRQGQPNRFSSLSEDERARLIQQMEQMRQNWDNMSDTERENFRAQMRERFETGQRQDRTRFSGLSPQLTTPVKEDSNSVRLRWEDMSEEQRQQYRERMRQLLEARRQGNE